HRFAVAHIVWKVPNQLADDAAQSMRLLLPGDVARDAARVLDVLLTMENFPDRLRHRPLRIPQVDRKNERVAAGAVVEDDLRRRVGKDAAVPVEFAIDLN